jgi:hypothetical protein
VTMTEVLVPKMGFLLKMSMKNNNNQINQSLLSDHSDHIGKELQTWAKVNGRRTKTRTRETSSSSSFRTSLLIVL